MEPAESLDPPKRFRALRVWPLSLCLSKLLATCLFYAMKFLNCLFIGLTRWPATLKPLPLPLLTESYSPLSRLRTDLMLCSMKSMYLLLRGLTRCWYF